MTWLSIRLHHDISICILPVRNYCECFEVRRGTHDAQVSSGKFMVLLEMIELWHDCIYTLGNSDLVVQVAIIGNSDTGV